MKAGMGRHSRRTRAGAVLASLAVAGLVLSACGSSDSTTATSTGAAATAAASGDPIRIGISLPLTGDFSQPGGEAQKGYNAWVANVNASGGLLGRQVELVILDDASSQEQVVTDYNNLISQEKVDLLLGTFSSLLNFPASTVAENNKMVLVAPAGGSPKIFDANPTYYFFAQQATAPDQANPFVNMIAALPDDQKPKTAAYVTQDDPFAAPVIESMQSQLEAMGVETVYSEVYPPETTNMQPFASKIASARAGPHRAGRGVRGRCRPGEEPGAGRIQPEHPLPDVRTEQRSAVHRRDRHRQRGGRVLLGLLEREGRYARQRGVPGRVRGPERRGRPG